MCFRTDWVTHKIDTGDQKPIKQPPRRLPLAKVDIAQKAIDSPLMSPIVLVKKKDGTQRFWVDYRKLNKVTRKESYPLSRIYTTLDALAGSKWVRVREMDMMCGY